MDNQGDVAIGGFLEGRNFALTGLPDDGLHSTTQSSPLHENGLKPACSAEL